MEIIYWFFSDWRLWSLSVVVPLIVFGSVALMTEGGGSAGCGIFISVIFLTVGVFFVITLIGSLVGANDVFAKALVGAGIVFVAGILWSIGAALD